MFLDEAQWQDGDTPREPAHRTPTREFSFMDAKLRADPETKVPEARRHSRDMALPEPKIDFILQELVEHFEIRIAYRGRISSLVQRAIEESPACDDYFRQRADHYFAGTANTRDSVIVAVKHKHLMETAANSTTQLCILILAAIGGLLGRWTYLSANRSDNETVR